MLATIIIVTALYFVGMFLIGLYGRKYSQTFDGFLSIDKTAGLLLIMGGCIGCNIGNGFVVGGAEAGTTMGLAGSAYGLACAFTGLVTAVFINDFVYKHDYQSLADFTRERYKSEVPGVIYDIAGAIGCMGLIAGQLMAGSALFKSLGLSGVWGVIAIAVVVFLYSQLAGLWGAYATSVVQTAIIMVGLILVTVVLLVKGAVPQIQAAQAAGTASPYALSFRGITASAFIGMALPVVLNQVTDQTMFMRICSAKSAKVSRRAHWLAFVLTVPLAIMPAFVGSYANAIYGIADSSAFFTVIMNDLPILIAAVIIAAVLAAVMSTIDSCLIADSSLIIRDLLQGTLKKTYTEKKLKLLTLIVNVVVICLCTLLALTANSILDMFNAFYSFLAAACFVPFVGGAIWKKGSAAGAIGASLLGVTIVVLGWLGVPFPSWGGFFPCIPGGILFVVLSLIFPTKEAAPAEA